MKAWEGLSIFNLDSIAETVEQFFFRKLPEFHWNFILTTVSDEKITVALYTEMRNIK